MDLRCAALEVHCKPAEWPPLLERINERKTDPNLIDQLTVIRPTPDGNYRVTIFGAHVDEFLEALPTRSKQRKQIKALRPKRVIGEPRG